MFVKQAGLSLLEILILILVIAIITTPLASGLLTGSDATKTNIRLIQAVSEARSCAEHVLYMSRDPAQGYASVVAAGNTICDSITAPLNPLTRTVTQSNASAETACPGAATACRQINIAVTYSGNTLASTDLLLVN